MSDLTKLPQAAKACLPPHVADHELDAFEVRFGTATREATPTGSVKHPTNGDEALYPDKSGTYTKCLAQKTYGVVEPGAFALFRAALGGAAGSPPGTADFEPCGLLGAGRKLNGPLGAFALTLAGADSEHYGDAVVPAPPAVASPEYAAELVELYWASLLRDVSFTQYPHNDIAAAAAEELTRLGALYAGPKNPQGVVTPELLFRGGLTLADGGTGRDRTLFAGEELGPYLSQLCLQPTNLGAQPIDQRLGTLAQGVDYMTTLDAWQAIQNGAPVTPPLPGAKGRFLHDGRGLGAFTHVDELYQAYLTAYLVLNTMAIGPNPTSPYNKFRNQQPFGVFGGPDVVATLGAAARAAINAVWYQKWIVHLRHRPESGGGIVHLMKTGRGGTVKAHVDNIVLESDALQKSHQKYGSYLLSQAFPEGSPAHPAYPTGHGTVAGACITVLKFFFDGGAAIPNPQVPSKGGAKLAPYTGADREQLRVNGELHKLAHNISFGHGIHAGIHWRSDTDYSILLGEAVALDLLADQAYTYKENFAVTLTKLDGSTHTIKNF
jgi:hypothetical protein